MNGDNWKEARRVLFLPFYFSGRAEKALDFGKPENKTASAQLIQLRNRVKNEIKKKSKKRKKNISYS